MQSAAPRRSTPLPAAARAISAARSSPARPAPRRCARPRGLRARRPHGAGRRVIGHRVADESERAERGVVTGSTMPRAPTCGSAKTSSMPLTGPQGTPASLSAGDPIGGRCGSEPVLDDGVQLGPVGRAVGRTVSNRGSSSSSGRPMASQKSRSSRPLAPAMLTWPSADREAAHRDHRRDGGCPPGPAPRRRWSSGWPGSRSWRPSTRAARSAPTAPTRSGPGRAARPARRRPGTDRRPGR